MKKLGLYYLLLAGLSALYVSLLFLMPFDSSALTRYNISQNTAKLISLTVAIPYISIWICAFMGAIKIKDYSYAIKDSLDGDPLRMIGHGLMILAVSMPLTAVISIIRNHLISQDSSLLPVSTIIYNYFTLGLVLSGFYLISKGAKQLKRTLPAKNKSLLQRLLVLVFVFICILYTSATMTYSDRQFSESGSGISTYYLPDVALLATIVIPHLIVWFLGFRASMHIFQYSNNVKGVLYRRSLAYLSTGIGFVVVWTILLRLFTSLTSSISNLRLQLIISTIYFLLIFIAIGYILIYKGASKLKRIEEV